MFIFSRFPNRNIHTFQYGLFKVIAIFLEWPVLILVEWEANPALMELGLSASLYHLPQSFGWRAWDNSPADPYNRYNMIACLWGLWSRLINLNVFVFSICVAFILSHDWASLFLTFYHGNSNICKENKRVQWTLCIHASVTFNTISALHSLHLSLTLLSLLLLHSLIP